MRNILVFSTNYLPFIGGAELAIAHIASHLPDTRFHLIAPRFKRSLPKEELIGSVQVYRVGIGSSLDKFLIPFAGLFKALSLNRHYKFDIAWSMMASQASIAAGFFKLFKRHIPLVLTLQEGDEEAHLKRYAFGSDFLFRLFIKPWHTLVFKVADLVTVISKHLGNRVRQNNKAVPIAIVPNGVDMKVFEAASTPDARTRARRDFGFSDSDSVVATVSRLVEKNRVDTLIRSIAVLPPNYKLLIAGEGHLRDELQALAMNLGVTSRVTFAGNVPPRDVPHILAAADVFARPSSSEGLGSAFLEAMAARVPVIGTPVGGITDFLTDKVTGLFCAVGDSDDLARKITVLTRDLVLRADIIEQGFKMVRDRYDWSVVALSMQNHAFRVVSDLRRERTLIATGIFPPEVGGPATYAHELQLALWRMRFATDVVTYGPEKRLPTGLRHFLHFFRLFIPTLLSDRVIVLDTFSSGLPALFAAKILRKKLIIRTGGDFLWEQYVERTKEHIVLSDFYSTERPFSFKEKTIFFLTRFLLRNSDTVVFSTEWQRTLWEKPYRLARSKTAIIENYYGEREASSEPPAFNFVLAGRSITIKNLETFKKAFSEVQKGNPEIVLEHLSLSHDDLMVHLEDAYAAVIPSLSEISPNLALEAIRFDRPFLLTQDNGLMNRIGKLGVFVDPRSTKSIEQGIRELVDRGRYAELKKELKAFQFRHSWDNIASEFVSIFETLQ